MVGAASKRFKLAAKNLEARIWKQESRAGQSCSRTLRREIPDAGLLTRNRRHQGLGFAQRLQSFACTDRLRNEANF
jgi:hypothetical protein